MTDSFTLRHSLEFNKIFPQHKGTIIIIIKIIKGKA